MENFLKYLTCGGKIEFKNSLDKNFISGMGHSSELVDYTRSYLQADKLGLLIVSYFLYFERLVIVLRDNSIL